jgi:hypothetical protein
VVGNIVQRKNGAAADQSYKYVPVINVHEGSDDKVSLADVEYKIPGKGGFRMTACFIHKLTMVVPVE